MVVKSLDILEGFLLLHIQGLWLGRKGTASRAMEVTAAAFSRHPTSSLPLTRLASLQSSKVCMMNLTQVAGHVGEAAIALGERVENIIDGVGSAFEQLTRQASSSQQTVETTQVLTEYKTLTKGQIRVLTLKDCSNERIQCSKQNMTLDEAERSGFKALSWFWSESSGPNKYIEVDGKLHSVPPTLLNASIAFRHEEEEEDPQLWIDYICINQADNVDKSQQIPLMSQIYGAAARVIIWLGTPDTHSETVMQAIQAGAKLVYEQNGFYTAMTHFCRRKWFTRIWILQVFALPREESLLRCGAKVVKWSDLQHARYTAYEAERFKLRNLGRKGAEVQESENIFDLTLDVVTTNANLFFRHVTGVPDNIDKERLDDNDGGYVDALVSLRSRCQSPEAGMKSLITTRGDPAGEIFETQSQVPTHVCFCPSRWR